MAILLQFCCYANGRRCHQHEEKMYNSALRVTLAAVALAASTLSAAAVDRHLTIHNDTGLTMTNFYSTNSGASHWGRDVLGSTTLPNGSSLRLNFDNNKGYCEFDFRAVFADGSVLQRANVNVCETGDYYYTE
jgi:hypothetical protein